MSSQELHIDHALDNQTRNAEIISILTVCSVLMTAVCGLRVYTRACITNSFGRDDAAIAIALVCLRL